MEKRVFPEEQYVYNLLLPKYGEKVRFCTPQEDHGHRKADLAVRVSGEDVFLQISRFPKSVQARKKLAKLGTYPVYVCNPQGQFDESLVFSQLNSTPIKL